MSGDKKRRVMSRTEVLRMNKLLESALEKVPDTDLWRYKDQWDDEKIAKATAMDLNATHTMNLRAELFGNLVPARPLASSELVGLVEALEAHVEMLKSRLAFTENKFNTLCDALSLNRVLDVRSCKIGGSVAIVHKKAG